MVSLEVGSDCLVLLDQVLGRFGRLVDYSLVLLVVVLGVKQKGVRSALSVN